MNPRGRLPHHAGLRLLALTVGCVCAVPQANAQDASQTVFHIEASNEKGTASWQYVADERSPDNADRVLRIDEPIPLVDPTTGDLIAVLETAEFSVGASAPEVHGAPTPASSRKVVVNFLVSTGGAGANFTVTSASLSFAEISSAEARATAAVTVTDFSSNGASLTGLHPDSKMYRAFYNDSIPTPATGTVFASLLDDIGSAAPFTSASAVDELDVAGGFVPIGAVSSMSAQWKFNVDPNSSASGTSTFVVAPANPVRGSDGGDRPEGADAEESSPVIFEIEATNAFGSGSWQYVAQGPTFDGDHHAWTLGQPIPIVDAVTGATIATLEAVNFRVASAAAAEGPPIPLGLVSGPVVNLNFLVSTAGGGVFTVNSANLAFPEISSAFGRATAAVTVTDFSSNGASLTGLHPDSKMYRAFYNDPGMVPATGAVMASLLDGIASPTAFTSASATDELAAGGGFVSIGAVSSMSSQWSFSVDPNSSASGTSVFKLASCPQPTVDGTRDAVYGDPIAVQTVETQFGDAAPPGVLNGSELDAAYATIVGGRLYLMLTGNLEPNFNKLEVFIDSVPGGENTLSPTPDYDFFDPGGCGGGGCWISTNLNGLTFDAGFTADYHFFAAWDVAPGPFEVDFVNRQGGTSAAVPGSAQVGSPTVGLVSTGTIPAGNVGPNASGTAPTQPLDFAINDNNAAGVLGGTNAADQTAAAAVATGMEFSIALADLGNPGAGDVIRIAAMINNGDHNFLSNQVLGGLPAPQGNLGGDGSGGFIGDLTGVDFAIPSGLQFFTTTLVDCNTNGLPDDCEIEAGIGTDCNSDGVPDSCQLCPPGTFTPTGCVDDCTLCAAGTFSSTFGATECEPCPAGTFADTTGAEQCDDCDPGSFAPNPGLTECEPCPPGRFVNSTGSVECEECAPGTFADATGLLECEECAAGTFADTTGLPECEECAPGTFADTTGRIVCEPCPEGTFADANGATTCDDCPGGAANACSSNGVCPPDTGICACSSGFEGATCDACESGYFGSGCEECPGGAGDPCNGNGTCSDGIDGDGTCTCDVGWVGLACELRDTDTDGIPDIDDECPGGLDTAVITTIVVLDSVFPGLDGVPEPLTRCIRFVATNGASGACSAPVDVDVEFTADATTGMATGTATITVNCTTDGLTHLCAKDEQHTLWDAEALLNVNSNFVTVADLVLLGGDTNNNGGVEINDATFLVAQWGTPDPVGGCPWNPANRGADFSNNGNTGPEDYTFVTAHWMTVTNCGCAPPDLPAPIGSPTADNPARIAALKVSDLPRDIGRRVDLNSDGMFDYKDMKAFERRHGLPNALSTKMKALSARAMELDRRTLQSRSTSR